MECGEEVMPSLDDESSPYAVRPLFDLKQKTPAKLPPGEEPGRVSETLNDVSQREPATSTLTHQFISIPGSHLPSQPLTEPLFPKTTRQLQAIPNSRSTRQLMVMPPHSTHQLMVMPPRTTRQLSDPAVGVSDPGTLRLPLVIKGEMKKVALAPVVPSPAEQQRKRRTTHLLGMAFLALAMVMTILAATPLGSGIGFRPWEFGSNFFNNPGTGPNSLVAQATATAIYHQRTDGYDPFAYKGWLVGDGSHSLDWPVGQCTYWSNLRYQQLSGYWVPWNGNADQWVEGARLAHWNISSQPHVPSIMVLMPGVQGASGYGHVAVVENIVPNSSPTTVETSNMNWYSNGGGFNRESNVDFTVGPGTYFVWHS